VVQDQDLGVLPGRAVVPGHGPLPVQDLDSGGRQPHPQPSARVTGRDGVVILPHADPGPAIHPGLQRPRRVEDNTQERLTEARRMQWLGEVASLEESLRHIAYKKRQAERLQVQAD
jgi:hypothetical protein